MGEEATNYTVGKLLITGTQSRSNSKKHGNGEAATLYMVFRASSISSIALLTRLLLFTRMKTLTDGNSASSMLPPSSFRDGRVTCHNGAGRHCEIVPRRAIGDVLHYGEYGPAPCPLALSAAGFCYTASRRYSV
eukprot:357157-Chlamydomonas_euryale.AAC.2